MLNRNNVIFTLYFFHRPGRQRLLEICREYFGLRETDVNDECGTLARRPGVN